MLGVFLDRDTADNGDLDLSALEAVLPDWKYYGMSPPDTVAARIKGAAVVVSNKVRLNETLLRQAGDLRLICVAATGTNNVDLDAAARLGIKVCNVRAYATPSVVQHVFALLLALSTRLLDYHRAVRAGRWQQSPYFCLFDYPVGEVAGKRLGIVGYGELGRGVAAVAKAFGMQVLIAQRPGGKPVAGRLPLEELLPQVDVLSLHCPLNAHTRGLIGKRAFAQMKPEAVLINTARGGIVDERALVKALREGRLGGAGIDVLSEEPPVHGNPLLEADIPNLIVTPHVAWASRESRQRLIDAVAENIRAYLKGRPQNLVA